LLATLLINRSQEGKSSLTVASAAVSTGVMDR
jgi:hypothetical protein